MLLFFRKTNKSKAFATILIFLGLAFLQTPLREQSDEFVYPKADQTSNLLTTRRITSSVNSLMVIWP
ncbi:hypothetical protein, partial [Microcystis sp.]|uniref:hypothetical protein n=1 Tax=Microcystis sp. TaxID=1127 RepID=UPI00391AA7BA